MTPERRALLSEIGERLERQQRARDRQAREGKLPSDLLERVDRDLARARTCYRPALLEGADAGGATLQ